jgi:SAM-dependent methyltransferase
MSFWDLRPCDGHDCFAERASFRYGKEPWLRLAFEEVARHSCILEIGCGQGTDAIEICRRMKGGGRYVGVDQSTMSIASARRSLAESEPIGVSPQFQAGDATKLAFAEATFDAIYSMGVLHHVDDTRAAIAEIRRVLRPGGRAYVALYNRNSVKLAAALALRKLQTAADAALGTDRLMLSLARSFPIEKWFGTALLECFGVPILKAYDRDQIHDLFRDFEVEAVDRCGSFGSFWFTRAWRRS